MLCLGFEPDAAGWWEQVEPLSYGFHVAPVTSLASLPVMSFSVEHFNQRLGKFFQPRLIVKTRGQTWLFWCKLPSKISRTCARTTTGDVTPYTTQPMTSSRRTAHDNCSKGLFRLFSTSYYFTTCRFLPTHLLLQTNTNVGIVRKGVGESEKGESVNENEREVRERNVE